MTTVGDELGIRRFRHGWLPGAFYVLGVAYLIVGIVPVVLLPGSLILKAVIVAVHGAVAAFFFRIARMGAYFSPGELRLVRMLRTDRLSWSVVERFTLAPRGTARLVGYVELCDGSQVWMQGIGSWYRFARRSTGAEGLIDEMNELLPVYQAARLSGRGRPSSAEPVPDGSMADLVTAGNGRYRTWHRAVLHMFVMTPGIALCVPLGVSILADPDDLESLLFGLAFLIGGLALALGLWRVIGACLLVHDEGVTVRTEWRARSWTWDEVAEFFVPPDSSMLFVRTADGSEVPVPGVSGLRPALFPRARDRFTLLAAELNLRLERERTPRG